MADLLDVETALQGFITALVYPNVTPPSALGIPVKIYAGWPDPRTLDADLKPVAANGNKPSALHVSIYAPPGMEQNTTRYRPVEQVVSTNPATYTLTASGYTVTVGGAAPSTFYPQNLAVFVNGTPYTTKSTTGQTTASLATALAALIPGGSAVGSVITVTAPARIGACRVGGNATTQKEVGRTNRRYQISLWVDTPANRSALAKLITPPIFATPWLTLADLSQARLIYHASADNDFDQKQGIYRRDIFVDVEAPVVLSQTAAQIIAVETSTSLTDAAGNVLAGPVNQFA